MDILKFGNCWIKKEDYDFMVNHHKKSEKRMHILIQNPNAYAKFKERKINVDTRKFAKIKVANKEILATFDINTGKAYKLDKDYQFTWMEIKKFEFVRWATGFDV